MVISIEVLLGYLFLRVLIRINLIANCRNSGFKADDIKLNIKI